MYRLGFSCCILPFLNNYILECNPCSVFIDRICLCCETITQELPVPGLCLGSAVSSTSPAFFIPNPTQHIFRTRLWNQLWNGPSQWIITSVVGSLSSNSGNKQIEKGGKVSSANCTGNTFFVGFFYATCLSWPPHQPPAFPPLKVTEGASGRWWVPLSFSLSLPLLFTQEISFNALAKESSTCLPC